MDNLESRGAQILDRFYDEAFAVLPEPLRAAAAEWVETDLITEGGTRRPYPLDSVSAALRPALSALIDHRLLRKQNSEQGDQIELVHDRLAAVALQRATARSQRLEADEQLRRERAAAEAEADRQRTHAAEIAEKMAKQLAEAAQADAQRERGLRKRAWWFAVGASICAVFGVSAGGIAWYKQQQLEEASVTAVLADNARWAVQESASQALAAAKVVLDEHDAASRAKARVLLAAAENSYNAAQPQSSATTCPDGRRVYPHAGSDTEVARLEKPLEALKAAGFIVPGTDKVAPQKLPSRTELRYFRRSEESGALAALAVLSQAGLDGGVPRYASGYENSTRIRPCHYELWLAARP